MNGHDLTLGVVGVLAVAGALSSRRISRSTHPTPPGIDLRGGRNKAPSATDASLRALRAAMVRAARADTAFAPAKWRRARDPMTGHCHAVAHIVREKFGGELVKGTVKGQSHAWNRLPGGREVDLSGSQYGGDGLHPLVKGEIVPWPKTVNPRFTRFAERVEAQLGRQAGSANDDYHMRHRPASDGPRAYEMGLGEYMPADVLTHPEWYTGFQQYLRGFWPSLRAAQGRPGAVLRMYRALPKPHATFREGDWVTLSREYAQDHLESNLESVGHIITTDVPASSLRFAGDDLMEWGYWGPTIEAATIRGTR